MSEIITKVQRSSEIAHDDSLAACQRVWPALENLTGLKLSDLNSAAKIAVEAELLSVYQIVAANEIEVAADYDRLSESDARDILSRINTVTQVCLDSEADRVMEELDTAGRKLPVAAINEVRAHPDIFVPLLMRALEQAIQRVRNGEGPAWDASFFAPFLLTELEVAEALPLLLEMLRLPDEGPSQILGDGVHELTPSMLALFSRDNTEEIGKIVQDASLDMFVRWATACAYKLLVRDAMISRQVAIDALHRHFEQCIQTEDFDMLAPLICELGNLAAETALETMRTAYQRELVDESIVSLDFIESQIAGGEETVKRELEYCHPTGMPDTIAQLERWAAFREEPPQRKKLPDPRPEPVPRPHLLSSDVARPQSSTTIVHSDPKVGRNEPCPCGSGKKFKKCCRKMPESGQTNAA